MMQLILASNNAKKLAELAALFAPLPLAVAPQSAYGVTEAVEPHASFVENALAKARHAAHHSGRAAIADDSGLCVAALGGAPGVASAHYAPQPAGAATDREALRRLQDAANNALLLERMRGVEDRRARYVAVLVALRAADDPEPLIAVGHWEGALLHDPVGSGGFGYDPLVYMPALGCSVAELASQVKQAHSHRAQAARAMLQAMREAWHLG